MTSHGDSSSESWDLIDGRRVPPTVIEADEALDGVHNGSVHVRGARFEVLGTLNGSLRLEHGAVAIIEGTLNGSLRVCPSATALVRGRHNGSAHIETGGAVEVDRGGVSAGSVHNEGRFALRGRLGGTQYGLPIDVEDGGEIVRPIRRGGVNYYEL